MPAPLNITNITPPREALTYTGPDGKQYITRPWYLFFLNLFNLTGGGSSDATIVDLLIAPQPIDVQDLAGQSALQEVGALPPPSDMGAVYAALDALNEQPTPVNLGPVLTALDGMNMAPTGLGGSVTSVATGTGLTGGPITSTGTVSVDQASVLHWTKAQTFDQPITTGTKVAGLPGSPVDGQGAFVTDAAAPAFGVAVVGGGTVHVPVYYDSGAAAWTVG